MNDTSRNTALDATFAALAVRAATDDDARAALDDALTAAIASARAATYDADAIATLAALNSARDAYIAARADAAL